MRRIFPDYVYGEGPRQGCYWSETCELPDIPAYEGGGRVDVAIIGAGFTGLNAAITLAGAGMSVAVLDAQKPGWGASGRNGGFCCLGGGMLSDAQLDRQFSNSARLGWRSAEINAVRHVEALVAGKDVERQSLGETRLAHRPRYMRGLESEIALAQENYGVTPTLHSAGDLIAKGMNAGFHGGITQPMGFALNPRKYLALLLEKALKVGARIYAGALVTDMEQSRKTWTLTAGGQHLRAEQVLIATNGYSAEQGWMAGRYMPVQSSVIVTRELTQSELDAQGWTSHQMCYDSRNLLHYFRLMPNNRMLFGMRGGLGGRAASEQKARLRARRDFGTMFPAWRDVQITHSWSGMVCLSGKLMPFVGPVPGQPGLHAAFAYHGNGVAMGSYSGHLAALTLMGDQEPPEVMRGPPPRFALGRYRRALMWPAYALFAFTDG
jgi:glycine/D-amino acid oxidase-like deaminating enzyme